MARERRMDRIAKLTDPETQSFCAEKRVATSRTQCAKPELKVKVDGAGKPSADDR